MDRLQFSSSTLQTIKNEPNRLNHLLFIDVAHFHLSGDVNCRNCRCWSTTNPSYRIETPRHSLKTTVYCGVWSSSIIGLFFLMRSFHVDQRASSVWLCCKNHCFQFFKKMRNLNFKQFQFMQNRGFLTVLVIRSASMAGQDVWGTYQWPSRSFAFVIWSTQSMH